MSVIIIRDKSGLSLILLPLLLLWLCGCATDSPSVFAPQSPAATRLANLWWLLFGLGSVIYVVVMGIMLYGLFRRRSDAAGYERWRQRGPRLILFGGALIPGLILLVIYGFTLSTLSALSAANTDESLAIEMTGHQWWWEVRYPNEQITTANEIHIPVGERVAIYLLSDDVIHSFWVPELNGKLDLVPGKTNTIWLQADEPGEYWGLCAEYCGIQHANMLFVVVAHPPEAFTAWLDDQRQPAPAPRSEAIQEGLDVFMEVECAQCHTISGTNATGDLGPDLTHFASRLTIGAGAVPNNRGNLSGWIVDSHGIKPGNLMPPSELTGPQLQALLAYLETLQ